MADLDAIFKAYDIRGTTPDQLDASVARSLGEAFALGRVDRFAFDIEVLHLVERHGWTVVEVPVRLAMGERTTVRLLRDTARLLRDLWRIRRWSATGAYEVSDAAAVPTVPATS